MRLVDSADIEHFHHRRQFYLTALVHTAENPEDWAEAWHDQSWVLGKLICPQWRVGDRRVGEPWTQREHCNNIGKINNRFSSLCSTNSSSQWAGKQRATVFKVWSLVQQAHLGTPQCANLRPHPGPTDQKPGVRSNNLYSHRLGLHGGVRHLLAVLNLIVPYFSYNNSMWLL